MFKMKWSIASVDLLPDEPDCHSRCQPVGCRQAGNLCRLFVSNCKQLASRGNVTRIHSHECFRRSPGSRRAGSSGLEPPMGHLMPAGSVICVFDSQIMMLY